MTQQTRWNMWIPEVKTFFFGLYLTFRKNGSFNVTHLTFSITLDRFEKRFENYWSKEYKRSIFDHKNVVNNLLDTFFLKEQYYFYKSTKLSFAQN